MNLCHYYLRVVRRAAKDTLNFFGVWTLLGSLILVPMGIFVHVHLNNAIPGLGRWLGEPLEQWWIWLVYVVLPLVLIAGLVGIVNLFRAPFRMYLESERRLENAKHSLAIANARPRPFDVVLQRPLPDKPYYMLRVGSTSPKGTDDVSARLVTIEPRQNEIKDNKWCLKQVDSSRKQVDISHGYPAYFLLFRIDEQSGNKGTASLAVTLALANEQRDQDFKIVNSGEEIRLMLCIRGEEAESNAIVVVRPNKRGTGEAADLILDSPSY